MYIKGWKNKKENKNLDIEDFCEAKNNSRSITTLNAGHLFL